MEGQLIERDGVSRVDRLLRLLLRVLRLVHVFAAGELGELRYLSGRVREQRVGVRRWRLLGRGGVVVVGVDREPEVRGGAQQSWSRTDADGQGASRVVCGEVAQGAQDAV